MVSHLRAKPGGDELDITIGNFATTTVDGAFFVAYLVFNTIMNLTTQAAQVACFRNVAAHLEPGGCFAVEVGVPSSSGSRRARRSAPSMSARRAGASTSTTSRTRGSSLITSSSSTARSSATPSRSATRGPRSST